MRISIRHTSKNFEIHLYVNYDIPIPRRLNTFSHQCHIIKISRVRFWWKKTSYKFARGMRAVILPPRMPQRGKELLRNDKGQKRDLDALPARVTARWRKSLTMVIVRKILFAFARHAVTNNYRSSFQGGQRTELINAKLIIKFCAKVI